MSEALVTARDLTKSYDNGTKVVPAYLLQPVGVDKSNYEKELVQGGYYTADQLK